jgi:hypothetical protein
MLRIRRNDRLNAKSGGVGAPKAITGFCSGAMFLLVFQGNGWKRALCIVKLFNLVWPEAVGSNVLDVVFIPIRFKGGIRSLHAKKIV